MAIFVKLAGDFVRGGVVWVGGCVASLLAVTGSLVGGDSGSPVCLVSPLEVAPPFDPFDPFDRLRAGRLGACSSQ